MKKKIVLFLLAVVVAGLGYYIYNNFYQKHIIFLKGNTQIVADETWVVGNTVFYRLNKHQSAVHSVEMPRVLYIKQRGVLDAVSSRILAEHLAQSYKQKALKFLSFISDRPADVKKWAVTAGGVTLILIGAIFFFKLKQRRSVAKPKTKKQKISPVEALPKATASYEGQEAIVQFFLLLFKYQKGIPEEGEALFQQTEMRTPDGNFIYELRVKLGDDWVSRRMTIGPIGEESGSRSTCYYVIYDDHLVVKIPPNPITNFGKYIQSLKRDAVIAEKLHPKECLIPRVSVILKKVHPFYEDDLSVENLEEKYIEWLQSNEDSQSFLKIGGTFVYFMDLSRYFFLGHILKKIHGIETKIAEEAFNQPDIIWNPVEFEARYGDQNVAIADNLHAIYTSFENRTIHILQQRHLVDEVPPFRIREWFLLYLSGGKLSASDVESQSEAAADLNTAAAKLFREKALQVERYRKMIRVYVLNKNLQQQKAQISGLITNLIDLLAWLNHKKIAMRDLKPDNLLVAGNPAKFPQFLESAALYSIGLIDVETAVSFDAEDDKQVQQPPLGGTPSYSTPSHMLRNDTLIRIFKDLPLMLHLQDWFATAGMIYSVVTGERLFERTAKTLQQLKGAIKDNLKKKDKPIEILSQASRTFWKQAAAELELKLKEHEKRFNYISAIVSKESKPLLLKMISEAQRSIAAAIQEKIASQTIFKGDKIRKNLYAAPHLKIRHFKIKFLDEQAEKLTENERSEAAAMLDELVYLKEQAALLDSTSSALQKSVPIASASDLLKLIFLITLVNMHQRLWGTVLQQDSA